MDRYIDYHIYHYIFAFYQDIRIPAALHGPLTEEPLPLPAGQKCIIILKIE